MWLRVLTTITAWTLGAPQAAAADLRCNKKQTRCVIESRDFTVGDQIGIFNADGELVATGQIKSLRGDRRAVLIEKKHGPIDGGDRLALLEDRGQPDSPLYKIYREPAQVEVGGSFGYSAITIGGGATGFESSGFAQWKLRGALKGLVRGTYQTINGDVRTDVGDTYENLDFRGDVLAVYGGAAYLLRDTKPWSVRGEAGVGAAYVAATVDGDSGAVDDEGSRTNLRNGIAPAGRWALGVRWNLASMHVDAGLAQSMVHQAIATTLGGGLSFDLP